MTTEWKIQRFSNEETEMTTDRERRYRDALETLYSRQAEDRLS